MTDKQKIEIFNRALVNIVMIIRDDTLANEDKIDGIEASLSIMSDEINNQTDDRIIH